MKRQYPAPPGMLQLLGVFGYEAVEWPVLCGLVTGDPILFAGNHGSAKTYLCKRIAAALGLRFRTYDASKNLFEDVIGFPDPKMLNDGRIGYIPTEISIWGTEVLLVDEISRANPEMQSKWLEIIRGRSVMGKPIAGLQYVLAAMNPPSYLGAFPLDAALAGRFAVIVTVPDCGELPDELLRHILYNLTSDDAPLSGLSCTDAPVNDFLPLADLLGAARLALPDIQASYGQLLSDYTLNVANYLQSLQRPLDGRRLGMLWRNLLAGLALYRSLHLADAIDDRLLDGLLYQILTGSLPYSVTDGDPFNDVHYRTAHEYGMAHSGQYALPLPEDVGAAMKLYCANASLLTPAQHERMATYLGEHWQNPDRDVRQRTAICLLRVYAVASDQTIRMSADTRYRLLELWQAAVTPQFETYLDKNFREGIFQMLAQQPRLALDEATALGIHLTVSATTYYQLAKNKVTFCDVQLQQFYQQTRSLLSQQQEEAV